MLKEDDNHTYFWRWMKTTSSKLPCALCRSEESLTYWALAFGEFALSWERMDVWWSWGVNIYQPRCPSVFFPQLLCIWCTKIVSYLHSKAQDTTRFDGMRERIQRGRLSWLCRQHRCHPHSPWKSVVCN
jgi:hypothetical protein